MGAASLGLPNHFCEGTQACVANLSPGKPWEVLYAPDIALMCSFPGDWIQGEVLLSLSFPFIPPHLYLNPSTSCSSLRENGVPPPIGRHSLIFLTPTTSSDFSPSFISNLLNTVLNIAMIMVAESHFSLAGKMSVKKVDTSRGSWQIEHML